MLDAWIALPLPLKSHVLDRSERAWETSATISLLRSFCAHMKKRHHDHPIPMLWLGAAGWWPVRLDSYVNCLFGVKVLTMHTSKSKFCSQPWSAI
ncbi:unnamed protein product [Fusarium venenatum]|uniref:Uncharacterized protein n=1 Tax=Fusarium venenatum TaxID=56646 RepID=A0A2L2TFT9_9HYPO|nr:LOW QUALITY PROTEIN: uncharacterized protein FVRRES_08906 [Fusarium venenatum]CEI68829.1 unnamed protein product [Fusarium venenatum]